MKVAHGAEMLRGQVMSFVDRLIAPVELDEADRTNLLRLLFELDRLAAQIEDVAGAGGGGA